MRTLIGLLLLASVAEARIGMGIVTRGPTTACAGETTIITVRLSNFDNEGNSWVALTARAVVHHADGTTTDSGNALPAPVLLPMLSSAVTTAIPVTLLPTDAGATIAIDGLGTGTAQLVPTPWNGRGTVLLPVVDCP